MLNPERQRAKSMHWKIEDVIDLECFFAADQAKSEGELRERDGEIYSEFLKPALVGLDPSHADDRGKIRLWLEQRRALEPHGAPTPGECFRIGFNSLLWIAGIAGLLFGGGLAASLFRWYGDRPINVPWFFAETVLVQIAVLLALLFLLVRHRGARVHHSLTQSVVSAALSKLTDLSARAFSHISGEQRNRIQAGLGLIRAKKTIYGSLAYWPVLIITQLFAVCFNIGLLVAILSCVRFSALSFGWYSTLERPNQYPLVELVSLPWQWLPNAKPTREQVEKSRVISLESRSGLDPAALRSWWPFLCYAVVFYGLLPRMLLLGWALWKQRRTLNRLPFDHGDCQALLARLGGLSVESSEAGPSLPQTEFAAPDSPNEVQPFARCIALAPTELELPEEKLVETIQNGLRHPVASIIRAEIDSPTECGDAFKALEDAAVKDSRICVVIAIESWQPPRQAYLAFIREVRRHIGNAANIAVMLVNDATGAGVADEDWQVWLQKIRSQGDPYLRLEKAG